MGQDPHAAEERFRAVFAHLDAGAAYARRRGSEDADGLAAEVMTIAWRRLADVPEDDPRASRWTVRHPHRRVRTGATAGWSANNGSDHSWTVLSG